MVSTIPSEAFGIILLNSNLPPPPFPAPLSAPLSAPPVGRHCDDVLMAAFVHFSPPQRHEF